MRRPAAMVGTPRPALGHTCATNHCTSSPFPGSVGWGACGTRASRRASPGGAATTVPPAPARAPGADPGGALPTPPSIARPISAALATQAPLSGAAVPSFRVAELTVPVSCDSSTPSLEMVAVKRTRRGERTPRRTRSPQRQPSVSASSS